MEEEGNNLETGTAIDVDEAAALISQIDVSEDSYEQTEEHVEEPSEEEVEASETDEVPEEQYFDLNGEQVSLSDLRNGYLRNSDYTKKTQEIAEQRKYFQENQRDINTLRGEALAGLEALKQQVSIEFRLMESDIPDFDYLAENDPGEYVRQKAIWERKEHAVRQMYEAEQHIKAKQTEYEAEQQKAVIQESSARFYEKYPDLKEPTKSEAVFSEITQLLLDTGFSKEEIQSVADFRIIDLLYRVTKAEKAQKAIPEVVNKINKKPVISQNGNSGRAVNANQKSFDNFNKTRSVADAAQLIKNLL